MFYRLTDQGVSDWVCIYEAILKGILSSDRLEAGAWVCVPMDSEGKMLLELIRMIYVDESEVTVRFEALRVLPPELLREVRSIRKFKISDLREGESEGNPDPFE